MTKKWREISLLACGVLLAVTTLMLPLTPETFADTPLAGTTSPLTEAELQEAKDTTTAITTGNGTFIRVDQKDLPFEKSEIVYDYKKTNSETKAIVLDDRVFVKQ